MLASLLISAALFAANPFTLGPTPTPAPSSAGQLPEIGRVRSITPGCIVMRDLVAPSYAAALRADLRFAKLRKAFPKYAEAVADDYAEGSKSMALAALDREAQAMRDEALLLSRALDDPRLVHPTEPQVIAEKRELQQLYDKQSGRANLAWEFVLRERVTTIRSGTAPLESRLSRSPAFPTFNPIAVATSAPGMPPPMRGNELGDKRAFDDWAGDLAVQVRASEHQMAAALLPISTTCR